MTSPSFLDFPAEIRNLIYRHVLCYDDVSPEIRSVATHWQPRTSHARPGRNPLEMRRDSLDDFVAEGVGLRVQLNVIVPIRNGIYLHTRPSIVASEILNLLRTCRQIYEEAHLIFWPGNAFIFPDQHTIHVFMHRIGVKSFELIRMFGIEKTVVAEPMNLYGTFDLGYWLAEVRKPPFLPALHLHGWEIKFEEFDCENECLYPDNRDSSQFKIIKVMIRCYHWLA